MNQYPEAFFAFFVKAYNRDLVLQFCQFLRLPPQGHRCMGNPVFGFDEQPMMQTVRACVT